MRIVIQKVTQASVTINGKVKAAIGKAAKATSYWSASSRLTPRRMRLGW